MAAKAQQSPVFLDDYLRSGGGGGVSLPSSHTPSSARAILQAWSDLRNQPSPSALQLLASSIPSLLISDPQAKLLLSLLHSSQPSPSLYSLLHAWLRKSHRQSLPLLSTLLSHLSQPSSDNLPPPPYKLLLLGALAASPALPSHERHTCLDVISQILRYHPIPNDLVPEALAGIGYALSVADGSQFRTIFCSVLGKRELGRTDLQCGVRNGLMFLRLVEWVVFQIISFRAMDKVEFLSEEVAPEKCEEEGHDLLLAVMAASGVMRAFRLAALGSGVELQAGLRNKLEESISYVAKTVVIRFIEGSELGHISKGYRILLQCVPLGIARCGALSSSGDVLRCVCLALLCEVFPIRSFCRMVVEDTGVDFSRVRISTAEHLDSVLFKEGGAITGVMCNQYASADEENKTFLESQMWDYCRELYSSLRVAALVLRGRNDELLKNLEKIAESAFLMVVVFAAEAAKHRLNSNSSSFIKQDVAFKILFSFSCIEYLRRSRLPEYTEAVRQAVLTLQESTTCAALFVESMPPYAEVINQNGSLPVDGVKYIWYEDEVQTARMLFYLRVIPTCAALIPTSSIGKIVVPHMFLFIQHPNGKVARASHSVFVAFMSSGVDSEQDDRTTMKEQLVFFYIQRALEGYPAITPFEGLASGVAALVRHVPAGSPALFYCVNSIVNKTNDLSKLLCDDTAIWTNWEGSSEPLKKIVELLLRLIFLVDIQVLPYLLRRTAEYVLGLSKDGQNVLLDDISSQVAESDDVTRKPVLVSWLQSLSFLCSQKKPVNNGFVQSRSTNITTNSEDTVDGLRIGARL